MSDERKVDVEALEWQSYDWQERRDGVRRCPECLNHPPGTGHLDDCTHGRLAAALREAQAENESLDRNAKSTEADRDRLREEVERLRAIVYDVDICPNAVIRHDMSEHVKQYCSYCENRRRALEDSDA